MEVRGEDIPFLVSEFSKAGKKAIGLTGEDLFREFLLQNPYANFEVLKKIPWKDPEAMFGKPALCLMGRKDSNLLALPKKLRIVISAKYKFIADNYLNALEAFYGFSFSRIYVKGATEATFAEGISDLIIDIVYTGRSMSDNGLRVYEKIIESDFVIIGGCND